MKNKGLKKAIWIISLTLLLGLTGFIYFKFYFVFGEGVKAGELNYIVKKGVVFKTYEGKLIQSGFRSTARTPGASIQSYEFEFSVEDAGIADSLMLCSGQHMELRYREYNGALPWRGYSRYVVYKIESIGDKSNR